MERLVDYLEKTLEDAIASHRRRKDVLRRTSWTLHISIMVAGMSTTILLGIKTSSDSYMGLSRNIALALGAFSTLLGGLLNFWNLDTYWLQRKAMLNQLIILRDEFRFEQARGALGEVELRQFFDQYVAIMGRHSEYWDSALGMTEGGKSRTRD